MSSAFGRNTFASYPSTGFLLGLLFDPKNGGDMFLYNGVKRWALSEIHGDTTESFVQAGFVNFN
jgi:hypothetical protein